MTVPTLFASRVNVAVARDTAILAVGSPMGPVQDGQIQTIEVVRLVMSHQTMKEVAELLAAKVQELELLASAAPPPPAPAHEPRRFDTEEPRPGDGDAGKDVTAH